MMCVVRHSPYLRETECCLDVCMCFPPRPPSLAFVACFQTEEEDLDMPRMYRGSNRCEGVCREPAGNTTGEVNVS